jgi:hypothetical protein
MRLSPAQATLGRDVDLSEETHVTLPQHSTSFPEFREASVGSERASSSRTFFSQTLDRIAAYAVPISASFLVVTQPPGQAIERIRFRTPTSTAAVAFVEEFAADDWQLVTEPMNKKAFEALMSLWGWPHTGEPLFEFRVYE